MPATEQMSKTAAPAVAFCSHCRQTGVALRPVIGPCDGVTVRLCSGCLPFLSVTCEDCGQRVYTLASEATDNGGRICTACAQADYDYCTRCDRYFQGRRCRCRRSKPFPAGAAPTPGGFDEIVSRRHYGIELETDRCPGSYELMDTAWGAKYDCTVSGLEFYSPILRGDAGLNAVRQWAEVARKNEWVAGANCGLHVHLDLRSHTGAGRYAITRAFRETEMIWFTFVAAHRGDSDGYSLPCNWGTYDLHAAYNGGSSYHNWARGCDRYTWLNCFAYRDHRTLEIRNHEGTCDGESVCNWVKACTRLADWAASIGYARVAAIFQECTTPQDRFNVLKRAWKDDALAEYYAAKARRLHGVTYEV